MDKGEKERNIKDGRKELGVKEMEEKCEETMEQTKTIGVKTAISSFFPVKARVMKE